MEKTRDTLKKNIKIYIQKNKLNQKDFAEKIGVRQSTVSGWVSGPRAPEYDFLPDICRALKIDANELLGMEKITDPNKEILLNYYKLLNNDGQQRLIGLLEDLILIDKYTTAKKEKVSGALDEITDEQICEELKYKEELNNLLSDENK